MKQTSFHPRGGATWIPLLAAAIVFAFVFAQVAPAQMVRGTLLGTVLDEQGGAVAGATVTAIEVQTGVSRTTVTNASGNYTFPSVRDGLYRVQVEKTAFKKVTRENVIVGVNTTVRADFALPIGQIEDTVVVSGAPPVLQTDRADTGRQISAIAVTNLPQGFARNYQTLLVTVPGATKPSRQNSEAFNIQDSLESKVNGQSRFSNNWLLEGVDNGDKTGYRSMIVPPSEAIEEISITTSNFDAEYGRAGGAVTSVTLKSGTNELHGSAFYFNGPEGLIAAPWQTHVVPPTSYNQFGFTLGGPIRKNRLFFFGDFQRTQDSLGRTWNYWIPPMAWRNGDFSAPTWGTATPTTIYDPRTGNTDGTGRQPFAGNVIPPELISPIAKKILALLPAPNTQTGAPGINNYLINTATRTKTTPAFDIKLNYTPTQRDQLSARFSFSRPKMDEPSLYDIYGGPANNGTAQQSMYSAAVNWTHALSATMVLDVRAGVSTYTNTQRHQGMGQKTNDELGIPNANIDDYSAGIAQINVTGFSSPLVGFTASVPWDRGELWKSLAATLTKMAGNHSLKVGVDLRHNRDWLRQYQDAGGLRGAYEFGGGGTSIPSDTKATGSYANALAAFLLDRPRRVSRDVVAIADPGTKHYALSAFAKDTWQVSKRLTVDVGLRWEYYSPLVGLETKGGLSNYDPATNTVRVAGYGSVPQNLGLKKTFGNFAPRLGAIYRIDDKTVARAGFGTTIIPFPENRYAFNFPVKQTNVWNRANDYDVARRSSVPLTMSMGFPAPEFYQVPDDGMIGGGASVVANSNLYAVPTDLKEAKLHSWNIAFQRQLPWNFVGEVAYVGNVGHGILIVDYNINAGHTVGRGDAGRPLNALYGRKTDMRSWEPTDTSYNGLQCKLDRRFSNGLLLTNSYTYSRTINYTDDNQGGGSPADFEKARGLAGYDRTHIVSSSMVWDLPIFKNQRDLAGQILGGWQIAGIFWMGSGTPLNISMSAANLNAPGNPQWPNLVGTEKVLGQKGLNTGQANPPRWFETVGVYAAPAPNTFRQIEQRRRAGPLKLILQRSMPPRNKRCG